MANVTGEGAEIEVGRSYYFVVHAYYHFLGTVTEITGKKSCKCNNLIRLHSCARSWTEFFSGGVLDDTVYSVWPDGTSLSGWFVAAPWGHTIPR